MVRKVCAFGTNLTSQTFGGDDDDGHGGSDLRGNTVSHSVPGTVKLNRIFFLCVVLFVNIPALQRQFLLVCAQFD